MLPDMRVCRLRKKSARLRHEGHSEIYTSGSIANSQRMPTEINKTGTIAKMKILVEQVMVWDIWRHLE